MQPYFFPYAGHFALIAHTDRWVVFDLPQYVARSWMNRNRILHPKDGWVYITVPLANSSRSIKIFEAKTINRSVALTRIKGQLDHYKRKAPYFNAVQGLVSKCFESTQTDSLCELNIQSLRVVCEYLNLPFQYQLCSQMNLTFPESMGPGDWALEIGSQIGATQYLNPIGGKELFNEENFKRRDIQLQFLPPPEIKYDCSPYQFIENLSVLDALMWIAPEILGRALVSGTAPMDTAG